VLLQITHGFPDIQPVKVCETQPMTELLKTLAAVRRVGDEAEQATVDALLSQLSDGWYVIPRVEFDLDGTGPSGQREFEIDCVLAHEQHGFAIVETKGHRMTLVAGEFRSYGVPLHPQPPAQLRRNRHGLADLLTREIGWSEKVPVVGLMSFPNTKEINGDLPQNLDPSQMILSGDLDASSDGVAVAVENVVVNRAKRALTREEFERCIKVLCPDADIVWDYEARARRKRERLRDESARRVAALEPLDMNPRVMVAGGAGSGKTRLALRWAQRALRRGESLLMVSYNDPLGHELRASIPEFDEVTVGPFLRVVRELEGIPPLEKPADAGNEWWEDTLPAHVEAHLHAIPRRFDTIIVDEAQDFSPRWSTILRALHSGRGPFLMMADPDQDLFNRGFVMPSVDDGWVRIDLLVNTRNSHDIARLLRFKLSGVASDGAMPQSEAMRYVRADDLDTVVAAVRSQIEELREVGVAESDILVATVSSTVRDRLRDDLGLVAWSRDAHTGVMCENVHRAKGTEFDQVVFVPYAETADESGTTPQLVDDRLLYVGISRAILGLRVIAPKVVLDRLGFPAD